MFGKHTENLLNLGIEGVIEIPQCGLYAKSPEALQALFVALDELGYEIKDCNKDVDRDRPSREVQEKQGWSLWYASLRDDVNDRKGKCNSCGSYIDVMGIQSHKHRCEVCGDYTYHHFVNGSTIRFYFTEDARGKNCFEPDIGMKIYDHDEALGCLLLYLEPINGNNFNTWNRENAKKVLEANRKQYCRIPARLSKSARKHLRTLKVEGKVSEIAAFKSQKSNRRFGIPLIAISYDPRSRMAGVINTTEMTGHQWNHKIVKLYKGKEYGERESLPIPESYSIYEAWHWMPYTGEQGLLHEKIIHAAGMVTDCGYYHQNGQREFYDIHLLRMKLFVENFTNIPINLWDAFIRTADKSGPGMIKEMAAFCQGKTVRDAIFENKPNIGNLIDGFCKATSGQRLSEGEKTAMHEAAADEGTRNQFLGIFKRSATP